jgi:very-short-patch-repair endonuclease
MRVPTADQRIAAIASRQRGRVTLADLRAAGLTKAQIARQLACGRIIREHRGVFIVGHDAPIPLSREMGALLACGPGSAISHQSAGGALGILPPCSGPVHVTVPAGRRLGRPGIRVHHAEALEVRRHHGLPLTSPSRTLQDLAAVLPPADLQRAVAEAHALGLVRPGELRPERGRRGAAKLRAVLEEQDGFTRSEAERRLLALVRRAGLPRPQTNARVAGFEVDALWRDHGLVVEVDGYATHGHRAAFERDRRRDRALRRAGLQVLRVTWRQLTGEPEGVAVDIAGELAAR